MVTTKKITRIGAKPGNIWTILAVFLLLSQPTSLSGQSPVRSNAPIYSLATHGEGEIQTLDAKGRSSAVEPVQIYSRIVWREEAGKGERLFVILAADLQIVQSGQLILESSSFGGGELLNQPLPRVLRAVERPDGSFKVDYPAVQNLPREIRTYMDEMLSPALSPPQIPKPGRQTQTKTMTASPLLDTPLIEEVVATRLEKFPDKIYYRSLLYPELAKNEEFVRAAREGTLQLEGGDSLRTMDLRSDLHFRLKGAKEHQGESMIGRIRLATRLRRLTNWQPGREEKNNDAQKGVETEIAKLEPKMLSGNRPKSPRDEADFVKNAYHLSLLYEMAGYPADALNILAKARVYVPSSTEVLKRMAVLSLYLNLGKDAMSYSLDWLKVDPGSADAHYFMGRSWLHSETGNAKTARRFFLATLLLDDHHPGANFYLGMMRLASGEPVQAERLFRVALRYGANSEKAKSAYFLAQTLLLQKRHAEAVPMLEQVLKHEPENPMALLGLALASDSLGRKKEAEGYWKRFAKAAPDHYLSEEVSHALQ